MSDLSYVLVLGPKSSRVGDSAMCLEPREEVVPTTTDDTTCLEEMDKSFPIHRNMNKMWKGFNQSMAMGLPTMGNPQKGTQNVKK